MAADAHWVTRFVQYWSFLKTDAQKAEYARQMKEDEAQRLKALGQENWDDWEALPRVTRRPVRVLRKGRWAAGRPPQGTSVAVGSRRQRRALTKGVAALGRPAVDQTIVTPSSNWPTRLGDEKLTRIL